MHTWMMRGLYKRCLLYMNWFWGAHVFRKCHVYWEWWKAVEERLCERPYMEMVLGWFMQITNLGTRLLSLEYSKFINIRTSLKASSGQLGRILILLFSVKAFPVHTNIKQYMQLLINQTHRLQNAMNMVHNAGEGTKRCDEGTKLLCRRTWYWILILISTNSINPFVCFRLGIKLCCSVLLPM